MKTSNKLLKRKCINNTFSFAANAGVDIYAQTVEVII